MCAVLAVLVALVVLLTAISCGSNRTLSQGFTLLRPCFGYVCHQLNQADPLQTPRPELLRVLTS